MKVLTVTGLTSCSEVCLIVSKRPRVSELSHPKDSAEAPSVQGNLEERTGGEDWIESGSSMNLSKVLTEFDIPQKLNF